MTLRRYILAAASVLPALLAWNGASAQHTLGFIAGYGMANGRFQPQQEMRALWGMYSGGLTWRYYGRQRFVGGFGVDLEFQQSGFSFATNSSQVEEKKDYLYYTRHVNTLVMPGVWQPQMCIRDRAISAFRPGPRRRAATCGGPNGGSSPRPGAPRRSRRCFSSRR